MIRAAALGFLIAVPALAQAACPDLGGVNGAALTGTWSAGPGWAQTMNSPMVGGSDEIVVQSSGGGITLVIEGRRIALNRLADGAPGWTWDLQEGVAVTAAEAGIVLGCDINDMIRYEGSAMGVTWRAMVSGRDSMLLHWSMPNPPSAGLFLVTR